MQTRPSPEASIRITPAASGLPANTLRFYVHFPRPGEAHFDRARLALLDGDGRPVADPFLVLSQELWSADGHRLTILMEPGRIKRGMGADRAHEPALVSGRRYSLALDAMGLSARLDFRVSDPVIAPLDETFWRLDIPRAGERTPVVLHFDRIVDSELCRTDIAVVAPDGKRLPASPTLDPDGRTLRIGTTSAWMPGEHRIVVSDRFEDVCGNRLGEALDHAPGESGPPRQAFLRFTPGSRDRDPRQKPLGRMIPMP